MKILIAATLFIVIWFQCGLSLAGGLEGAVKPYATEKLGNLTVYAITDTDIKEELPLAKQKTKTNSEGIFTFKKLLAHKTYRILVTESGYSSNTVRAIVPEEGTRLIRDKITFAPTPPSQGIWVFSRSRNSFKNLSPYYFPVNIRSHEGLGGNGGLGQSHRSAFSVDPQDLENTCFATNDDFIFVRGVNMSNFTQLSFIASLGRASIPDGYYLNVKDFSGKNSAPTYTKPNLRDRVVFEGMGSRISAYRLSSLSPGFYCLVTKTEKQNMGRILGGETAPRKGFLLYVDRIKQEENKSAKERIKAIQKKNLRLILENTKQSPIRVAVKKDLFKANGEKMDAWKEGLNVIKRNNAKMSEAKSLEELYNYDLILWDVGGRQYENIFKNLENLVRMGKVVWISAGYGTVVSTKPNNRCDFKDGKWVNCQVAAKYANEFIKKFGLEYKTIEPGDRTQSGIPFNFEINMTGNSILSEGLESILGFRQPYLIINNYSIKTVGDFDGKPAIALLEDDSSGGALIIGGGNSYSLFLGVHNSATKQPDFRIHGLLKNMINYTRAKKITSVLNKIAQIENNLNQ